MMNEVENYDTVIDNSSIACTVSDPGTVQNNSSTSGDTIANVDNSNIVSSDSQIDDSSNVSSTCVSSSTISDYNVAMSDLADSDSSDSADSSDSSASASTAVSDLSDDNIVLLSSTLSSQEYTIFDKPLSSFTVVEGELLFIVLILLTFLTIYFMGVYKRWFH